MNIRQRQPLRLTYRIHPLAAAVAATLGSSWLLPVAAQAAEEGMNEIVVTASRREESVQDIPYNISVIGEQQLEAQRLDNLADLGRIVPGLTVVDQGPRAGNRMTVRGLNTDSLNATEFLNNTSGNVVGTYISDIPLYLDLKLRDIARVEALLGPQGTLYGAGTLGGAIRYIPNKPVINESSVQVEGTAYALAHSTDPGFDGDIVVNLPLVQDQLAWRLVFGGTDDPGFIDYDYLLKEPGVSNPQPDFSNPADVAANLKSKKDANDEKTLFARSLLLWTPADDVDATFGYYFQNTDVGARQMNQVASFNTSKYVSAYRYLEPNERQNHLFTVEVSASGLDVPLVGRANLTSATGYSIFHENGQRDQTDLLLSFEYGYEDFPAFSAYTYDQADENRFNEEIRLVSDNDTVWNWIVGLFYNSFDTNTKSEEFTPGYPEFANIDRPDNREYVFTTDNNLEEKSVFGELGYHITEAWQVTVGGRYFDYDEDVGSCVDFPLVSGLPTGYDFSCTKNRVSESDFLYKLNTSLDLSDDVMVYATLSEGYRIGGVNSGPTCPDPVPQDQQQFCLLPYEELIKPDRTTNYEVGIHSAWLDRRLVFNGTVYLIDWKDIQVTGTSTYAAQQITRNGSKARSTGTELTAQFAIDDNWSVHAGYAYVDAQLTAYSPGLLSADVAGEDGDRLAGTPRQQGSLDLRYTTPVAGGRTVSADYGLTSQSDVYTKVGLRDNGEVLGGFTVHNASVTLSDTLWEASLYADNLTDKFAVTGVRLDRSYIGDVGNFALRNYHNDVLRPREVGLRVKYKFGL